MSLDGRTIVGSTEWCTFSTLGIPHILARVDSGAKTSSIHAFNITRFEREGEAWVSFEVHPVQNVRRIVVRCEAKIADRRSVKSSTGVAEKRYVIRVPVTIGAQTWDVELTLSNRDSMGHRMLLGREAMSGRILVHPDADCLTGKVSKEQIRLAYESAGTDVPEGLRIGILGGNPDLYSNRRLVEAADERGHQVQFLSIKNCYMKLDSGEPRVHYRGGRVVGDLDAVIPRIRPSLTFYGCALARHFEAIGVATLNSASAILQSRDKLHALQLLLAKGLDIPTTGFANSPAETGDLIDMVGGAPLVVKLLEGTQGRGVVLAETRQAAEGVINAFKSLKANLLVQEFIREAESRDLRCFVIDGKVVASMERRAADGEFRANMHHGGTAHVVKISAEERTLAIRAAKVLRLRVAGVNIIRSRKGPLLLEVNSSPDLEGIEDATGKDIAGMMIAAIEKQLGWQRPVAGIAASSGSPIDASAGLL